MRNTERPRPQLATVSEEGEIDNGSNEIFNEDENFLDELISRILDLSVYSGIFLHRSLTDWQKSYQSF